MGQWLRLGAFTAVGLGSIPGPETKIPQGVLDDQKDTKHLVLVHGKLEEGLHFVLFPLLLSFPKQLIS